MKSARSCCATRLLTLSEFRLASSTSAMPSIDKKAFRRVFGGRKKTMSQSCPLLFDMVGRLPGAEEGSSLVYNDLQVMSFYAQVQLQIVRGAKHSERYERLLVVGRSLYISLAKVLYLRARSTMQMRSPDRPRASLS